MNRKLLALILAAILVFCTFSFAGCAKNEEQSGGDVTTASGDKTPAGDDKDIDTSKIKIGVILVGDENEGYTFAHIDGIKKAAKKLNISDDQIMWKYTVGEDETCKDAALDLADAGCNLIVSNSYGHQTYMQEAAGECPDTTFVSMTGDTAANSGLANFKNAFTNVYESRYVSGVVAGMKLAELVADKKLSDKNYDADGNILIGYVGAYPYAEVVSGYTAFYLGIKSVVENVSMLVQYTQSWFDIAGEGEAANALMSKGCVIIGQHADSTGAPAAVQAALDAGKVAYSVGYNVDMLSVAPTAALTSSTNCWEVYYEYAFSTLLKGEDIATDWSKGYTEGAVAITELGKSCAEGTAAKVEETIKAIKDGTLHVFNTDTFTVEGKKINDGECKVDLDGDFKNDGEKDKNAVWDGYFHESELRSAPSFSLRIDGITELNNEAN